MTHWWQGRVPIPIPVAQTWIKRFDPTCPNRESDENSVLGHSFPVYLLPHETHPVIQFLRLGECQGPDFDPNCSFPRMHFTPFSCKGIVFRSGDFRTRKPNTGKSSSCNGNSRWKIRTKAGSSSALQTLEAPFYGKVGCSGFHPGSGRSQQIELFPAQPW
jgi:hypothetical protein